MPPQSWWQLRPPPSRTRLPTRSKPAPQWPSTPPSPSPTFRSDWQTVAGWSKSSTIPTGDRDRSLCSCMFTVPFQTAENYISAGCSPFLNPKCIISSVPDKTPRAATNDREMNLCLCHGSSFFHCLHKVQLHFGIDRDRFSPEQTDFVHEWILCV